MKEVALVFPHQLYQPHPALAPGRPVWLVEDQLYFTQYPFHQQKILLHRASMKHYAAWLAAAGHPVEYRDVVTCPTLAVVVADMVQAGVRAVHVTDPTDFLLKKRILRLCNQHGLVLHWTESPNFLTPVAEFESLAVPAKGYLMARFYMNQRRRLGILVEPDGSPVGGKWSFDADNRKKVPAGIKIPAPMTYQYDPVVMEEARTYVRTHFSHHYGQLEGFQYPVTRGQALAGLADFIRVRLRQFGDYEDAMVARHAHLWHSVLTPALNIGLLQPEEVVAQVLAAHADAPIPLNSLEGFIRQVIGWREFVRLMYLREGVPMRTRNFFDHQAPLTPALWEGRTGLLPYDHLVQQLHRTAYSHHISRLMIAGNLMLLAGIHPDEVYRWFMCLYIDAYDWVMVPNVYAMSQYADGGLMTTKPYISGSAYVLKMSDYPRGAWCAKWDALYWQFVARHVALFRQNPRMSMMAAMVSRMDPAKLAAHQQLAAEVLEGPPWSGHI
ncbi:MAG: cryptochrome/photolyase family protein [Bacteroidia bacterium]|nr:cryptochrome/photolyase family protein [Bacteroidia bacterium]